MNWDDRGRPVGMNLLLTDINIEWVEGHPGYEKKYHGTWDGDALKITIWPENLSPQYIAKVFLHELIHAAFWVNEFSPDDADEEAVTTYLSNTLSQIFRLNPGLLDWYRHMIFSTNQHQDHH